MCNLGYCYYEGHGCKKDYTEAVKWYRLAVEQGIDKAQYNLGLCYFYGDGVEQNYEEAIKWFLLAANQGHTSSQHILGECYEKWIWSRKR